MTEGCKNGRTEEEGHNAFLEKTMRTEPCNKGGAKVGCFELYEGTRARERGFRGWEKKTRRETRGQASGTT